MRAEEALREAAVQVRGALDVLPRHGVWREWRRVLSEAEQDLDGWADQLERWAASPDAEQADEDVELRRIIASSAAAEEIRKRLRR